MKPLNDFNTVCQTAQVFVHIELFEVAVACEALAAPFFKMFENPTIKPGLRILPTEREMKWSPPNVYCSKWGMNFQRYTLIRKEMGCVMKWPLPVMQHGGFLVWGWDCLNVLILFIREEWRKVLKRWALLILDYIVILLWSHLFLCVRTPMWNSTQNRCYW